MGKDLLWLMKRYTTFHLSRESTPDRYRLCLFLAPSPSPFPLHSKSTTFSCSEKMTSVVSNATLLIAVACWGLGFTDWELILNTKCIGNSIKKKQKETIKNTYTNYKYVLSYHKFNRGKVSPAKSIDRKLEQVMKEMKNITDVLLR